MSMHQRSITGTPVLRPMSIEAALSWAFINEKAQLDFDEYGAHEFDRLGVDPIWRGMQMQILGTSVDGGGSNPPHIDAQIIAGAVERLDEGLGGRAMALQIVELARARSAPDWGQGDRVAVVPFGWDWDEDIGDFVAFTARTGSLWRWRTKRRQAREARGEVCPVGYTGTARGIAAKRRNYLAWWGALLDLQSSLSGRLHMIEITDALPPLSP
ncbi:hypothetical protein [Paracoccus sp. (in: a-proteobacteria)]|uniref:hypothetical protein n=1 Tax=Paracoccus sp. TaxID=267 RepID=UPI0028A80F20|nr:hypothetical protein [Paracoccus sp. (in: a-proteobacteria)]